VREELGVGLCWRRMQECLCGGEDCPLGRVTMGSDADEVVSEAKECVYAGLDMPAYYYRGLVGAERKRYGAMLSHAAVGGRELDGQAEIA